MEKINFLLDDDSSESPHLKIYKKNFSSFQKYKYNTTIYKQNNKNTILYNYFKKNNFIKQMKVSKNNHNLHKKIIKEFIIQNNRLNREDTKNKFLKKFGNIHIDNKFLKNEIIDDHFTLKYFEELKENMMCLFFLNNNKEKFENDNNFENENFFLCFYDLNNKMIKFYEIFFEKGEENKIRILKRNNFKISKNKIYGLFCIENNGENFLLLKHFCGYSIFKIQEKIISKKIELILIEKTNFEKFFIKKIKINKENNHIGILLESVGNDFSKIIIKNLENKKLYSKKINLIIKNIFIYNNQDKILFNTKDEIYQIDKLSKKINLLKKENNLNSYNIYYNVFNYESSKIFGFIDTKKINFLDYRFPKSGILSLNHNMNIPPENYVFNKSKSFDIFEKDFTNIKKNNFDEIINNYRNNFFFKNRLFFFSLRKNGGICTLPHIKYMDENKIINPFAYNLIKEINLTIFKQNKFLNILEHQNQITRFYTSNFKYENFSLDGFQVLRLKNLFLSFSLEENSFLNFQIFEENKKKKIDFQSVFLEGNFDVENYFESYLNKKIFKFGEKIFDFEFNEDIFEGDFEEEEIDVIENQFKKNFEKKIEFPKIKNLKAPKSFVDKLKEDWSDDSD